MTPPRISFGQRLGELALQRPSAIALTFVDASGVARDWTRDQLDRRSNRIARYLDELGVVPQSLVAIGLPNCPDHLAATHAVWKLGGLSLPLPARSAPEERRALLKTAAPVVVMADWADLPGQRVVRPQALAEATASLGDDPLPDRISHPGKAVASGGSTGQPKIIVDPNPWTFHPGELVERFGVIGFRGEQRMLIPGPLYHNAPFLWAHYGLFEGARVILTERFDAAQVADLIERYRVEWTVMVPTMLRRIALLPGVRERDWSSLDAVFHTAAPCPAWVKRAWIDLIGPERLWEAYGSTENIGAALIRGDEWLRHPGSVGRPFRCDMRILDSQGRVLPPGEVGEVFSRPHATSTPFVYRNGASLESAPGGFLSVGDLGWLDADGFLYLADRRVDLIITGGANVYPAEVEAALSDHPAVADVAVVGRPDDEWGARVHAVIQLDPAQPAPTPTELQAHCRSRLSAYKIPRSFQFMSMLPRNEAGKLRRDLLAAGGTGGR